MAGNRQSTTTTIPGIPVVESPNPAMTAVVTDLPITVRPVIGSGGSTPFCCAAQFNVSFLEADIRSDRDNRRNQPCTADRQLLDHRQRHAHCGPKASRGNFPSSILSRPAVPVCHDSDQPNSDEIAGESRRSSRAVFRVARRVFES
jgi:hypothetical protein